MQITVEKCITASGTLRRRVSGLRVSGLRLTPRHKLHQNPLRIVLADFAIVC